MLSLSTGRHADALMSRHRFALLVVFAACACLNLLAGVAHAGTVAVTGQIQGAGSMSSVDGGPYSCSRTGNQNDRVTVACQRETFGAVFSASVTLRATPAPSPGGNWFFVRWEGCQALTNNGQDCQVNSGSFSLDER